MCHEPGLILVSFSFLFLARSRWLGRHLFPFDADLFLYIYLCVSWLLCQIIMFCSHSASSPFRAIVVTLCFVKNSPVWSGRVPSSVWPYLCPVSQLSVASGPFASGRSPPDCTALCGSCCLPLWPGPHILSLTSSLLLCSSFFCSVYA